MHRNTAFRWHHRFLKLPNEQKAASLVGIAEADETFFLESFQGKKHGMTRPPHKRGGKALGATVREIGIAYCPINLAAGVQPSLAIGIAESRKSPTGILAVCINSSPRLAQIVLLTQTAQLPP